MLSEEKQLLLSGLLGQLPEHVALRLAKAVEVDRLIGGTGIPHEEILRALRPQLRLSPVPARTDTPQRLFCGPFEDLLTEGERKTKQKGRIDRASIERVWQWLANDLMAARHRALEEALRQAIMDGDAREIEARLAEFHRESAAALKDALAGDDRLAAAADRLGGPLVAEDAREIALLVEAADEIAALQSRVPKPIPTLTDEEVYFLRDTYERLAQTHAELAAYVPLIVMGRLQHRWEVLRLIAAIAHKSTDTIISGTDLGLPGEVLFSDLESYVRRIQTVRPPEFDCPALIAALNAFAELSSGMVKELGIRRDGKWGHRLAKYRADVAQTVETLIGRAQKEILAALPPTRSGFGRSQKTLDVSRPPDPAKVERAVRFAQLLAYSRPASVAAAYSAKLKDVVDELSVQLRTFGEEMLREVRAATPESRERVRAHFDVILNLATLILGEEESDFLRRRARVNAA